MCRGRMFDKREQAPLVAIDLIEVLDLIVEVFLLRVRRELYPPPLSIRTFTNENRKCRFSFVGSRQKGLIVNARCSMPTRT